jgi:hypothetical protein
MKHFHHVLPLALAAVLTGMAIGGGGAQRMAANSRADLPAAEAVPTELASLAVHGREHLGREVRLTLQVESLPEQWNPYLTRFGRGEFRAVTAWGDEQDLWAPEEYAHPAATLFVRRGSAADAALGSPGRYARFEAVGVVRQMFLGRPWIELTRLEPLSQQFTEGSMIHASRAVELMAAGHWGMAAESFERALASDLPARARTELDELRTLCLSRAPRTPPGTKRDGSAGNASGAGGSGRQVPAAQAPPSTKTGES